MDQEPNINQASDSDKPNHQPESNHTCPPQVPRQAEYTSYATGPVRPTQKRPGLFTVMALGVMLVSVLVSLLTSQRLEPQGAGEEGMDLFAAEATEQTPETAQESPSAPLSIPAPEADLEGGVRLQLTPRTAEEQDLSYQAIYQKVIPSVVAVVNQTTGVTGTGVIMSGDGYLITNYQTVQNGASCQVLLQDNSAYDAALVGGDETSDLAVLKIDATGLTPAEFGRSDSLQVGDPVLSVGDPLGIQLRGIMTDGILAGIHQDLIIDGRTMTLLQTNAVPHGGSTGGPLVNLRGQVIGITTSALNGTLATAKLDGLSLAIPSATVKEIVDELLARGYVVGRPSIGITGETVPVTARAYYQLPAGVYIRSVDPLSDAWAKGLRAGDIITAINGVEVSTVEELNAVKNQAQAGQTVTLVVYHAQTLYQIDVALMAASGVS